MGSDDGLFEGIRTGFAIVSNISSVVFLVIVNKALYEHYGFAFPNTLMAVHFTMVAVAVVLYRITCGLPLPDEDKRPTNKMLLSNVVYHVLSVMFVNLSLRYNTVGTYQVLKLVNIPAVCVLEYFFRGITYSMPIKLSLGLLLGGVGMTTATDVMFTRVGLFYGMIATVATAAYQITVKDLMHGLDSAQSLYYTAPPGALLFALLIPAFDDVEKLWAFRMTPQVAGMIAFSGFLAICIQVTVFMIIGKTNPVTYQVVGHSKTLLVIIFGILAFSTPVTSRNMVGMAIAFTAVVWYTRLKLQESAAPAAPAPSGAEEQSVSAGGAGAGASAGSPRS